MKQSRVAVLPLGAGSPKFQEQINSMLEELIKDGWELDKINPLDTKVTLVVFKKDVEIREKTAVNRFKEFNEEVGE